MVCSPVGLCPTYVVLDACSHSTNPLQSGTKRKMGQEECANCGRRVFLAERIQVENRVFHRSCFRCMVCNMTLRPGAHRFDGGQFYCASHYTTMKRSRNIKKVIEERGISEDALYTAVKKPKSVSPPPPQTQQQQESIPALPPKQKHQQSSPPPQSEQFYNDPLPAYTAVTKDKPGEDNKSQHKSALSKVLMDAAAAKAAKSEEETPGKTAPLHDPKDGVRPVALEDLPEGHYEIDPVYMHNRRQRRSVQFHDEPTTVIKEKSDEEKEPAPSALPKVFMDTSVAPKVKDGNESPGKATPVHSKDPKDAVRPVTLEDLPEGHYETDPEYMDNRRKRSSEPQLDEYLYVIPPSDVRGGDKEVVSPALPANPPPVKGQLEAAARGMKPAENGGHREPYRPDNITQSQVKRAIETVEDAKKRRPPPPRPAPFRRPPPVPPGALNAPQPRPEKMPRRKKKKKITLEQIDAELQQISEKQQQLEERGVALEQEIRQYYDSKLPLYVRGLLVTIALSSSPHCLNSSSSLPLVGRDLCYHISEQVLFCLYLGSPYLCVTCYQQESVYIQTFQIFLSPDCELHCAICHMISVLGMRRFS